MRYIQLPDGIETEVFILDSQAISATAEVLKKYFVDGTVQIVADGNTYRVAGSHVFNLCRGAGLKTADPIILPADPKPHPDYTLAQTLAEKFPPDAIPVAVGSGVINDLVKCASAIKKLSYCCIPTAASVDGYTASGGAMSVDGQKKTVPCPAPYAIIADREIMATAPAEMMASGYADLMSKVTGGADWIIADELGIEKIQPAIWSIVQDDLLSNLANHNDLEKLFLGLAATGYSMQMYGDSRPASGAEHLCSHVWEMEHLQINGEEISHGFKVGIGLLAIAQLQEFIINTPVESARAMAKPLLDETARKAEIADLLKLNCYGTVAKTAWDKSLFGAAAAERRQLIFAHWEMLQKRLPQQLLSSQKLRDMLQKAQAPTRFEAIGLDREQYLHGIRTAALIRKRYTVLDMLYEAGLLESAMATLINE